MKAQDVMNALAAQAKPEDAAFLQRFFKTGSGQYSEGDVFIGVRVPQTRAICKQYKDLPLGEVQRLLESKVHEHRLAGLVIMANAYPKVDSQAKQAIFDVYLKHLAAGHINNWDLVDISAPNVVGAHLAEGTSWDILKKLAKSEQLWERRVAMVSTFYFLQHGNPKPTLAIATILLHDTHDLIQKAVGWMLREMGKRVDEQLLITFLQKYYRTMPRTMLRYAIERLATQQKTYFMKK